MAYRYNPFSGNFDRTDASVESASINFLEADSGGPIGPDGSYVIYLTGNATQGLSTSGSGNTINFTISNASSVQKGVASFDATNFSVSSGNVTSNNFTITAGLGLTDGGSLTLGGSVTLSLNGVSSSTSGQVLQSAGAAVDPVFSTATYPSVATGTGTILRADGTNWVASTATYPNTTTATQLLYSSATNVVGEVTSAIDGVLISSHANGTPSWLPNGTAGFVLTAQNGAPPAWAANPSGYSASNITVSATVGEGDYTTIAAALAAASAGDNILIREGTYTENLTLVAGVNLVGFTSNGFTPTVTIIGKCTFTGTGTVSISGIRLQTNSDFAISLTGANNSIMHLTNCFLNCTNNTGMQITSSGTSGIRLHYCQGDLGTTGIAYFTSASANININYSRFTNSGGSTTASSTSAALTLLNSEFNAPISTTSAGNVGAYHSFIQPLNVAAITTSGTGGATIFNTFIASGTASTLSVGSSTSMLVFNSSLSSSNTNVITGSGSASYANLTFNGSSSGINVSTYIPLSVADNTVKYIATNFAATPYTALVNDQFISVDTTGGAVSILLPNAPTTGRIFYIKDKVGNAATSNISVTTVGGAVTIDGSTTYTMSTNYQSISVVFNGTNYEVF